VQPSSARAEFGRKPLVLQSRIVGCSVPQATPQADQTTTSSYRLNPGLSLLVNQPVGE
jgi:hypothetical protein